MQKLMHVGGFLIEVSEGSPSVVSRPDSKLAVDDRVGGSRVQAIAEQAKDLPETIQKVCEYVRSAFTAANSPDQLSVKFGIKLTGEIGIPYVTSATGEATIEIEAKWSNGKSEGQN